MIIGLNPSENWLGWLLRNILYLCLLSGRHLGR
jgi:hypothetical protein